MKTGRLFAALCLVAVCVASAAVAGAQTAPATVTLRGQVACSDCWFEKDRAKVRYGTKADLKCAANCASTGVPGALAVADKGGTTLYVLEDGKTALGQDGKDWSRFAGQEVEVTGTLRVEGTKQYLKVDSIKPLEAGA